MPSMKPPGPVAAYLDGANAQDADAVVACFAEFAVVRDEGRDRHGIVAIREWANEVSQKYRPVVDVIDIDEASDRTLLRCRVSGNFPGSPVELRYVFTLRGDKIARLEIS